MLAVSGRPLGNEMLIYLEIVIGVGIFAFLCAVFTKAVGPGSAKPRRSTGPVTWGQQMQAWSVAMLVIAIVLIIFVKLTERS